MCGDTDEFGVRLYLLMPRTAPLIHANLVPQIPPIRRHRPQGES
jgi:hypothetical protein